VRQCRADRICLALTLLLAVSVRAETIVAGVDEALLANVLAYLSIDDLECSAGDLSLNQALAEAPGQATVALNAFGYYAPDISLTRTQTEDCWRVEISIDPGQPVRLRDVSITLDGPAAEEPEFQVLRVGTTLVPGAPLRHGEYDALKRNLAGLARNRGYAEADFTVARIDIYPEELAADIELAFASGPRYAVGEVTVNQDELEPAFVNAFHDLVPGVPFDNRLLTSAFLDLNNSGYFAGVDVSALPPDPVTRTIPVEINLTPAAHRLVSYGVGYSTDTGPRFRFGRLVRRFNRRGHQLTLDGQLSPVVSELTTIYRMPLDNPRNNWINFNVGAKREETETSLSRSIEAGVRRIVDRSRGWSRTLFVNYVFEDFEVASQSGRPQLLIPGVDWIRIRGDDALRPTNGSKLNFEVLAADQDFLSDTSFVQAIASIKWIRTVFPRSRLLLRGRLGYLEEEQFDLLPPSIRFFAGGDNSIRGYDFEALGPVDADGAVIGGNRLFEASVEFEREVKPKWSVAVFADYGNAFTEHEFDGRTGAGLGARWRSPLGPVRIDVAWPVHDRDNGARLHISLGPDL